MQIKKNLHNVDGSCFKIMCRIVEHMNEISYGLQPMTVVSGSLNIYNPQTGILLCKGVFLCNSAFDGEFLLFLLCRNSMGVVLKVFAGNLTTPKGF